MSDSFALYINSFFGASLVTVISGDPMGKNSFLPSGGLSSNFSISAGYELFEWGTASLSAPIFADSFLGIQGDIWDAQKDMLLSLLGALIALSFIFFKTNKKR